MAIASILRARCCCVREIAGLLSINRVTTKSRLSLFRGVKTAHIPIPFDETREHKRNTSIVCQIMSNEFSPEDTGST